MSRCAPARCREHDGIVLDRYRSPPPRLSWQVLVRVRPLLPHEVERGERASLLTLDTAGGRVGLINKQGNSSNFAADHVCAAHSSQDEIFHAGALRELVGAVAEGYNATVFAYGQTGSGKTFTMEGYDYAPAVNGKVRYSHALTLFVWFQRAIG